MSNPAIRPLVSYPGPGTNPLNLYTQMAITVNELINQVVASGGTVTHTGALTLGRLIVGNGAGDIKVGDLSGDVTTSGGTATTIGAGKVTNAMLAGSIDLATKVTGTLPLSNGGLGSTTGAGSIAAGANLSTDETTSSVTYTDLATVGPAVTVTTGTAVLVFMAANAYDNTSGAAGRVQLMSLAVSGSTTLAASDSNGTQMSEPVQGYVEPLFRVVLLSGLTAGSNTFTLKYRVTAGTGHFANRSIAVLAL